MRIECFLAAKAAAHPAKTALITKHKRLSFEELDDLSSRLAAALFANGVRRNDRVLIFMDNCWEAAVSIFAVLKAGATFSPINASTKAEKLAYIIADCDASAILTQAKLMPVVAEACGSHGNTGIFVARLGRRPWRTV
jgi:acyl-CoA synthetase (AMP-forming)/AMP-acid ligase II